MVYLIAAFTDHLTVCVRISLEVGLLQRGRGLCKMNMKILEDNLRKVVFIRLDKVENVRGKISGHCYVALETFRTENPFLYHPRIGLEKIK